MVTAILSALPEEQGGLAAALQEHATSDCAGRTFHTGTLHGQRVVLALSGIGKVAAAITATLLIERFGARRLIFTGVAGGLGEGVRVGDVVVARHTLQHDMDASPIFPRWELPLRGTALLACDAPLSALLLRAASAGVAWSNADSVLENHAPARIHHGLIVSGDRFVSTARESALLRTGLLAAGHDALAVEMEGAAVAQACSDYGVPCAILRTISDRADDSAHVDFSRFVRDVASGYAERIVQALLPSLPR